MAAKFPHELPFVAIAAGIFPLHRILCILSGATATTCTSSTFMLLCKQTLLQTPLIDSRLSHELNNNRLKQSRVCCDLFLTSETHEAKVFQRKGEITS